MTPARQPVAVGAAISGVLSTGVALVAILWPERFPAPTVAAIVVFGNAVILAGGAIWTWLRVTPTAAPKLEVGTSVLVDRPEGYPPDSPPPDAVVTLKPGRTLTGEAPR